MKTVIEYEKSDKKVLFESLKDRDCFYSSGNLYMKIMQQDLDSYEINSNDPVKGINTISILNAGLTFFQADETVYKVIREHEIVR